MARLEIKLKQHTPLIQFQGEQYNATLRATEFKPKLDRFLIKYVFNDNFEEYKKYLIGYKEEKHEADFGDKRAFNYKLRFSLKNEKQREKIQLKKEKKTPLYFGNMGDGNEDNWKVHYSYIYLEVFSYNKEIIEKIIEILPQFLMKNNFGQRQSKGYGSFYINDKLQYKLNNNIHTYSSDYLKEVAPQISFKMNNINDIFKEIEKIYNKMRREYIYEYIEEKYSDLKLKLPSDSKKIIKDIFVNNKKISENGVLIKDLLGLASQEEWGFKSYDIKIKKEHKSKEITRIKSPIFFKIIEKSFAEFDIYITPQEDLCDLSDEIFIVEVAKVIKDKTVIKEKKLELKMAKGFNVNEFISFSVNKYKAMKKARNQKGW